MATTHTSIHFAGIPEMGAHIGGSSPWIEIRDADSISAIAVLHCKRCSYERLARAVAAFNREMLRETVAIAAE
jgi:hypothetical protein